MIDEDIFNVSTPVEGVKPESGLRKIFLKIGGVLAVVLHPCFLFFYCFLAFYFIRRGFIGGKQFWALFAIVLGFTVIIPSIFPIIYTKDAFLKNRKKRPLSLFITLISYSVAFLWINSTIETLEIYETNWDVVIYYYNLLLILLILGLAISFIISFWF